MWGVADEYVSECIKNSKENDIEYLRKELERYKKSLKKEQDKFNNLKEYILKNTICRKYTPTSDIVTVEFKEDVIDKIKYMY